MFRFNQALKRGIINNSRRLTQQYRSNASNAFIAKNPSRISRSSCSISVPRTESNSGFIRTLHTSSRNSQLEASPSSSTVFSPTNFKVGDKVFNYVVENVEDIPELCLTAIKLRHSKTGAEHLHIARDDSNNTFAVSFRTTPYNSTGVAHILEHLALCGSQKYPVRDPFFKMLTRSLSTFMNAFTGPDYTMYPFSTQNQKDYYNLMSIYMDAVFHPRLSKLDFMQEGWRLEHEKLDDKESPIVFKGVVFNEMKGAFSSQAAIYSRKLLNNLFPDNTYKNESGGDPIDIPTLSYEELKDFHAKHYHPSNSRFFTYGNLPLETHLQEIDKIISEFEPNPELKELSFVNDQQRWTEPKKVKLVCQNDPMAPFADKQTTASVVYMLESLEDTHENFTLAILSSLLTDGPSSPFHQALIDSGLGSDYSPYSGYQKYTKQTMFSIGLQGISSDDFSTVLKAINMAFENAYDEGFPQKRIDAILHQIEVSTKHQTTDFGLGLACNVNTYWNHGVDPLLCLQVNQHIERFQQNMKSDPKYLQKKIKQYFMDNKHKLVVEMSPSDDYEASLKSSEKKLLDKKVNQLSKEEREMIYENGLKLAAAQDKTEDLSVLPTLTVKDISTSYKKTSFQTIDINGVPVQYSAQPTNGIVYFRSVVKLRPENFPKELIPILPVFANVMNKLGAGPWDKKQLDQEIMMKTGSLGANLHIIDHTSQFDSYEKGLVFSSHCLERNTEAMFDLWREIFYKIRFEDDLEYLGQLIRIAATEISQSVSHDGHRFAMGRAAASFGGALEIRELTAGLSSMVYHRYLAGGIGSSKKATAKIAENLKKIANIVLSTNGMRCVINAEAAAIRNSLQFTEKFIETIANGNDCSAEKNGPPVTTPEIGMPKLERAIQNEHFEFPFSTNYLAKAIYCVPFQHPDYAKLTVASSLVSSKFLHREIREKGGAYGGGAKFDSAGVFHFFSYRDPEIEKTIESFDRSGNWLLRSDNYDENQIDEAKLKVFQVVDAPIPPSQQGLMYFLTGITDDMKQEYRMRLLKVNVQDIQEVADKYLIGNGRQSGVVLLGPKSTVTANAQWKVRKEPTGE